MYTYRLLTFISIVDWKQKNNICKKNDKDFSRIFYEEDVYEERYGSTRCFVNKKVKYVWDIQTLQFTRVKFVHV